MLKLYKRIDGVLHYHEAWYLPLETRRCWKHSEFLFIL